MSTNTNPESGTPFGRFLAAAVNRIGYLLILTFVIRVFEGTMRVWYHLDRRVYQMDRRILSVRDGRKAKKSETYVILVLLPRYRVPAFLKTLLDAIARSDMNLVVICNGRLPQGMDELHNHAHLVIERVGLGRDFGAYKDGIALVRERYPNIERLILMNDSLFYFEKGLDAMLAQLRYGGDLVGTNETFEHHYHVQSFILSFSRQLLDHPRFKKYWRKYRPISTRRWSIHKGEVGFTRCMMKAGITPHILYHGAALGTHLRAKDARDLLGAVRFLPSYFRRMLYPEFDAVLVEQMKSGRDSFSLISQGADHLRIGQHQPDEAASAIKTAINDNSEYQRWKRERFVERIVGIITTRNQCHTGGFLFMKYLGAPIAKRDVFYRQVYELEEVYDILGELEEPLREEVMADLRQKGTATQIKGLVRVLHNYGAI